MITEAPSAYFEWLRLNAPTRTYQLRVDKNERLTLNWQNIKDTSAIATAQADCWRFTCLGYLSRHVVAYSHPSGRIVGTFTPASVNPSSTAVGTFEMLMGESYELKRVSPMRPDMIWEDASGHPLVHFRGDFYSSSKNGIVEVMNQLPTTMMGKTPFLISLGWYLLVSAYIDMALIV
jgi:hypothetical protein